MNNIVILLLLWLIIAFILFLPTVPLYLSLVEIKNKEVYDQTNGLESANFYYLMIYMSILIGWSLIGSLIIVRIPQHMYHRILIKQN